MTSIPPTHRRSGDHAHPLPLSVVERCATTAGAFGTAHGASATGLRLPEETEPGQIDQVTESLAYLSANMRASYAAWQALQRAHGNQLSAQDLAALGELIEGITP